MTELFVNCALGCVHITPARGTGGREAMFPTILRWCVKKRTISHYEYIVIPSQAPERTSSISPHYESEHLQLRSKILANHLAFEQRRNPLNSLSKKTRAHGSKTWLQQCMYPTARDTRVSSPILEARNDYRPVSTHSPKRRITLHHEVGRQT
jgi:hypothetical protein